MPALSEYSNVYDTALGILHEKGFQLWHDKETDTYYAEKDGWDFCADSPCALLGLISIYEHRKPTSYTEYWWRRETAPLYGSLPDRPSPYVSVTKKLK